MDPALQELYAEGTADDEVALVIRLANQTRLPDGVRLMVRFGDIATCRVRRGDILRLHASDAVKSVKAPRRYHPGDTVPAEAVVEDLKPLPSDVRRPSDVKATGQGVLVGHIDWGADFTAADFRKPDGSTRFRALWDQGAPYDVAHPNRYGYGRIYRSEEIDKALAAADPFLSLGYDPARAAPKGGSHGSHTLGISAGNGRSGGVEGVAPEADIAFVDMSTRHDAEVTGLGDSAAFLEALNFFAELAAETGTVQPLVVNASLGRQCGPHDGSSLTEEAMNAFLLAAPGRAICQSAGNYFDRHMHAQGELLPGEARELHIDIDDTQAVRHEIDLWYPGDDSIAFFIEGPGVARTAVAPDTRAVLTGADGRIAGRGYHRLCDPNNSDNEITVFLDKGAPHGRWTLTLEGQDIADGRFHAWIERADGAHARFASGEDAAATSTGTIANGRCSIAAGAFDAHAEGRPLAHFSSAGPTRDGRRKPDLVAPGVRVLSVRSRAADEAHADPALMRLSGSSMSSPSVAGLAALMFGIAPRLLSIHETRWLLLSSAERPPEGDVDDRNRLGCGYLDVKAALRATEDYFARSASKDAAKPRPGEGDLTETLERNDTMQPNPPAAEQPASSASSPMPDPLAGILPPDLLAPVPAPSAATELKCQCSCTPAKAPAAESVDEDFAGEADRSHERTARNNTPAFSPGFQVQVPIGGGAPALAMPIGGPASPFAFTLPLGGTSTPMAPVVVAASATAAPGPAPDPAGSNAPVAVAADTPLFVPEEYEETVESRCARCAGDLTPTDTSGYELLRRASRFEAPLILRSASDWLRALIEALEGQPFSPAHALPSASALFNAFVFPHLRAVRQLWLPQLSRKFAVLARPGDSVAMVKVRPGDLLIRVSLGQQHSHVALVASAGLSSHRELASRGLVGEGHPFPEPGLYVHVLERFPRVRAADDGFARRMADDAQRLLADTLLLRWQGASPGALRQAPPRAWTDPDLTEQVGPDSPVADRFVQASAVRFCTPGQAGSLVCAKLPTPRPINRVIIHVLAVPSTSKRTGVEAVVAGWQNPGRQAASHYLVDRDGSITQMVREADVAFHTPGANADSIGIEHADVCNQPDPLTDRLYERSAELVRDIAARNGFTADATTVRGHSQVNPNHDDPGPYWDWEFYLQWLAWSGNAGRPCRRVGATADLSAAPAGWQVQNRRAISTEFCADARDPWGETYLSTTGCDALATPAEVSLVLPEVGAYSVSLWWPRASDATTAAQVDVEVACLQSPCIGISSQTLTVNQKSGSGRWNQVTTVNVTRAPSELKVRWHCPAARSGRVLADAVRALKIASRPNQSQWPFSESDAEAAPISAPRSACAYFFKGGDYVRYAIGTDGVDYGPAGIASSWRLPPPFQTNLDAVVNWGNGKVYFFKGGQYLRYNIATDRVDVAPTPIGPAWPTLPAEFAKGIDAAVNWGNGKVYFFKGSNYVRYDIASDGVDVGPESIAAGWPNLPSAFQTGIQATVNWGNGKVYFFKGGQYLRYDIKADQPDFPPAAIAQGWPSLPPAFQRDLKGAVNWTDPCDLAALFQAAGLSVVEEPGWRSAGHPGVFAPIGIVMHHTAGRAPTDLSIVINGRRAGPGTSALLGPLAHFYVGRDAQVHMIASGIAFHAGPGAQVVLREVLSNTSPPDTAAARGLPNGTSGNEHFYGFECENLGDGVDTWPEAQLDAMARAAAALCQRHGWGVERIISHAEWTRFKVDPRGFSMADFRQRVKDLF